MSETKPIAADVLGPMCKRLLQREASELLHLLRQLPERKWSLNAGVHGSTIGELVEHLAEDAERLASAWEEHRFKTEEPLFHALEDLDEDPGLTHEAEEPEPVIARYKSSMDNLNHALALSRQEEWSWPAIDPHGGVETLAETARRWLAHHYVHRMDIHQALELGIDPHSDTVRCTVEFVLDAIARAGKDLVEPPIAFEVCTMPPGSGTWTIWFDDPESVRSENLATWQRLLGWQPREAPAHRVEEGHTDSARVRIYGTGEEVWRTGFGRGCSWNDLSIHADDEAKDAWEQLLQRLAGETMDAPIGTTGSRGA